MKLGIVMSPGYPMPGQLEDYLKRLPAGMELIGWGEDDQAHKLIHAAGIPFSPFPIDEDYRRTFKDAAPFKRNELVVGSSEQVTVFWDVADRNTTHVIRLALMAGKLRRLYTPWGLLSK